MLFENSELRLIQLFQMTAAYEKAVFLPNHSRKLSRVFNLVADSKKWRYWTDSSGHEDPPPDFYCDQFRIMMDVMRVDDHERKNPKGKPFSPHKQHEQEVYQELEKKGILAQFPNANVIINSWTGLPTYEDHNYTFYRKSFTRIVQKHVKSIPNYKANHPGFKVIFFVFDESSAYIQTLIDVDRQYQHTPFDICCGDPHLYYLDPAFLSAFIGQGIDYLIWFAPYKKIISSDQEARIPKIVLFDLAQKHFSFRRYNECRMISAEL